MVKGSWYNQRIRKCRQWGLDYNDCQRCFISFTILFNGKCWWFCFQDCRQFPGGKSNSSSSSFQPFQTRRQQRKWGNIVDGKTVKRSSDPDGPSFFPMLISIPSWSPWMIFIPFLSLIPYGQPMDGRRCRLKRHKTSFLGELSNYDFCSWWS